ncbi:endonuclease/exonuclease/phosphatase family protein [Parasulfitobacter algicola]|uniref:endonuclease/exonuclease/phosphatase family protein n=1 Tax=Parasulfitobacter algicola TaxID=2614809 RepID=UPI001FECF481|nr:endonuclease/exonuclease/phosphatase family protein [Sulfitobacter algicola]
MVDHRPIINDINAANADFVTLQEVSRRNWSVLNGIENAVPYQAVCPFAAIGDVAIASRWPIIKDSVICPEKLGMVAAQFETPDGKVWLVSIHLHWPWPHGQRGQAEKIIDILEPLDGPILIGGDFNMVPWSYILGHFVDVTDTKIAGPVIRTFPLRDLVVLPIDHIFAPAHGQIESRPQLGSDHFGIVAQVGLTL